MKKIFALIISAILIVAMAFSLAACNVDLGNNGGDDTNDPTRPDSPDIEKNPDADVQLTVGLLGKQDEKDVMQAWINAFQKANPEVSIKITKNMGGMAEIINWASAGDMPDIVWTAGDQHSPYSGSGYFQDLSDESKFEGSEEFFADFYDTLIETTHYSSEDEGIWFVPRDYNRLVIYINETAFEQAGVAVPDNDWTWEEFLGVCQDLMDAGVRKAIEWKKWRPVYTTMLTNYGGEYLDSEGNFALNTPEAKACYEFYESFYDTRNGFAISGEGASFKAYSGVLSSAVPMIVDVRPQLPDYISTAQGSGWSLTARAFPNFEQKDGSAGFVGTGCSGYGITTACTDDAKREWAWKFLKWCMSVDGYNEVAYLGNIVPALESMRDSGDWTEYSYGGIEIAPDAFVYDGTNDIFLNYFNPLPNQKQDGFVNMVDSFWNKVGVSSFATAVSDLEKEFDAYMSA